MLCELLDLTNRGSKLGLYMVASWALFILLERLFRYKVVVLFSSIIVRRRCSVLRTCTTPQTFLYTRFCVPVCMCSFPYCLFLALVLACQLFLVPRDWNWHKRVFLHPALDWLLINEIVFSSRINQETELSKTIASCNVEAGDLV